MKTAEEIMIDIIETFLTVQPANLRAAQITAKQLMQEHISEEFKNQVAKAVTYQVKRPVDTDWHYTQKETFDTYPEERRRIIIGPMPLPQPPEESSAY